MKKNIYLIIFYTIIFSILIFSYSYAAWGEPKLVSTLNDAFEKIEDWLLKLATPAAAVAVGTGVFMKKFSFGDEEKIRTGKNLIRGSIVSYVVILLTDMILSLINTLLG